MTGLGGVHGGGTASRLPTS